MKKQTKALWRILAAALLFGFTSLFITGCDSGGGGGSGGGTAPVTGVSLDKTTLTISVGDMETLKATVTPDDAISKSVTWSSSNASVARVSSSGVVTGVSAGYAIVTVTTVSGSRTANCYVIVSALTSTITSITVSPSSVTVESGTTQQFSAVVNGTNNPSQTVSWSVSGGRNSSSSTISSSGLLTVGRNETSATLTVTARSPSNYSTTGTSSVIVKLGSSGTSPILTSIDEFGRWLSNQPPYSYSGNNNVGTPYTVKLNLSSSTGIGAILKGESNKYVSLDLSGSTFTSIGEKEFEDRDNLCSITLPNSVTKIGRSAFSYFMWDRSNLLSVNIGNGVTIIEEYAFYYCDRLTSLTLGNNVISIGDYAFYHCDVLPNLTIPNSVTSIGKSAFNTCARLSSLTIPNNVTSIGDDAFSTCYLTNVTIGNRVTSIGKSAFSGNSFTSITIPSSVTSIGDGAFNCSSLTSVMFQSTIPATGFGTSSAFPGDLRTKFYATDPTNGTPGTYTRSSGSTLWYKQ